MKTLTATAILSLSLLAPVFAQTKPAEAAPGSRSPASAPSQSSQKMVILRSGSRCAQPGPAENFTGSVRVTPLFEVREPSHASGASVSFEPGARSAWHTHPFGQILIVTAGVGRVQQWAEPIEGVRTGDVVWTPPGVKHWHGASPTTTMTHIAI